MFIIYKYLIYSHHSYRIHIYDSNSFELILLHPLNDYLSDNSVLKSTKTSLPA